MGGGFELGWIHRVLRRMTFRCHYFTGRGGLIGGDSIDLEISPRETEYHVWVSWGNRDGNYWRNGMYYVECDADGMLLASRYFTVEP